MGKGFLPAVGAAYGFPGTQNVNQNSMSTNVAPTINVHVGDIAAAMAAAQNPSGNSANNAPQASQSS